MTGKSVDDNKLNVKGMKGGKGKGQGKGKGKGDSKGGGKGTRDSELLAQLDEAILSGALTALHFCRGPRLHCIRTIHA